MIIGIVGKSGSGKDTVAGMIPGANRFSFADPLKEFCAQVFDWNRDQLWGPSELRNVPDKRYPRKCSSCEGLAYGGVEPPCSICHGTGETLLTPRYALQQLGTEWGRGCFPDIWAQLGVRRAQEWIDRGYGSFVDRDDPGYPKKIAIFSDCRFLNEAAAIRAAGGKIWRVVRLGAGLTGAAATHVSEMEQEQVDADVEIHNSGTLDDLRRMVELALR